MKVNLIYKNDSQGRVVLGSNFATSFDLSRGKDVGQGAMSVLGMFMCLFDISPPKLKYH